MYSTTQSISNVSLVRYEVLTAVSLKIQAFWDMTLFFGWVAPDVSKDLHLQSQAVQDHTKDESTTILQHVKNYSKMWCCTLKVPNFLSIILFQEKCWSRGENSGSVSGNIPTEMLHAIRHWWEGSLCHRHAKSLVKSVHNYSRDKFHAGLADREEWMKWSLDPSSQKPETLCYNLLWKVRYVKFQGLQLS